MYSSQSEGYTSPQQRRDDLNRGLLEPAYTIRNGDRRNPPNPDIIHPLGGLLDRRHIPASTSPRDYLLGRNTPNPNTINMHPFGKILYSDNTNNPYSYGNISPLLSGGGDDGERPYYPTESSGTRGPYDY